MIAAGNAERATDAGRVLVAVYALFAVAAGARSGYQIASGFHEAPLAFVLSALAAALYLVACLAFASGGWGLARACVIVELVGVLAIGCWSAVDPSSFPRETVWSGFGAGYRYVPVLLPVAGVVYLARRRPAEHDREAGFNPCALAEAAAREEANPGT